LAQIAVLDDRDGMVVQAAANLFGVRPAPEHVGRALPHEVGTRIGQPERRPGLRLGRLYLSRLYHDDRGRKGYSAKTKHHALTELARRHDHGL
jgi:hypothetical protein